VVYGGPGNNRIFGSRGADRLFDGAGRDRLSGGRGNDVLVGDWGRDRLSGESGNDTLLARDGRADKAFGATGSTAIGSIGGSTTRGRSRRGSELRTIGIWREHIETDPKR
jgi:Ca2+-binding RTX toxin-like protein